jgi:hypothetical protein
MGSLLPVFTQDRLPPPTSTPLSPLEATRCVRNSKRKTRVSDTPMPSVFTPPPLPFLVFFVGRQRNTHKIHTYTLPGSNTNVHSCLLSLIPLSLFSDRYCHLCVFRFLFFCLSWQVDNTCCYPVLITFRESRGPTKLRYAPTKGGKRAEGAERVCLRGDVAPIIIVVVAH